MYYHSFFKAKLETKALKAKRPGFTDERYNETSYYYDSNSSKSIDMHDFHDKRSHEADEEYTRHLICKRKDDYSALAFLAS